MTVLWGLSITTARFTLGTLSIGWQNGEFHDKPNDNSRGIIKAFVNGYVKIFSGISEEVHRTSTLPFANFVVKSFSFGPQSSFCL